MKNVLKMLVFIQVLFILVSCERDEICLEEITPKLIIRFYNDNIPTELKSVINLKVNIQGIDEDYTNETITILTDSIAIPLQVAENNTKFILTIQGDESEGIEDNLDTITIAYNQEDIFVSRSCGYKTVFNETSGELIDDDDNWIKNIETANDSQAIIDENAAHVKIYH